MRKKDSNDKKEIENKKESLYVEEKSSKHLESTLLERSIDKIQDIIFQKIYNIFKLGYVCDNCLGRQFAQLLSGMNNKKRGRILRGFFALALDYDNSILKNIEISNFQNFIFRNEKINSKLKNIKENNICFICNNFFEDKNLERWKNLIIKKINKSKIEFRSFVIGTKLKEDLAKKEEELWEAIGIDFCEPIKTEINRTIGKEIEKEFKKKANLQYPDIVILINLESEDVSLRINPIFIYGEYQKLVRGIAQTKSRRYENSVEEIIAGPLLKITKGIKTKFHGAGREDVDARCLGWRPFVIEVIQPKKRFIDLKELEKEINKSREIKVRNLRFSNVKEARKLKEERHDKEYRVKVVCERKINKDDLKKLKLLEGIISQRTPTRVLKRRGDKLRKRIIKRIKAKQLSENSFELILRCEAGLYVKELVSGDNGRTKPSVAEILGCDCKPIELDVIKIYKRNKAK